MNNFTTQLFDFLFKNESSLENALQEVVRSNIETAINELLESELTAVLDYEKYARSSSDNARNGYYERDFNTSYGILNISIPRDRKNKFKSKIIPKYERHDDTTEESIMRLFRSGLSNYEISNVVEQLYDKKYSKGTISNITNHFMKKVEAFKNKPINKHYAVIYTDATYVCLRRGNVTKEAVYIALGITPKGNKEVLGFRIAPTENCEIWRELFIDLKNRGLEKANLFCTDGLAGFSNVIEELFDSPKIQRCLVHVTRNLCAKVKAKERKEICKDFKNVYQQENRINAEKELALFINKWKRYPSIKKTLDNNPYLFTFFEFPKAIQKSIYNTNMIESFNRMFKRVTSHKLQFPSEEALEKVLVSVFEEYNAKFINKKHIGFNLVPEEYWN